MVLIVALVMLVIIGVASVAVMRNVMSNDLVSENNRRHAQAMQAAQTALRYCEGLLATNQMTPAAAAATEASESWRTFQTWTGTSGTAANGGPVRLPVSYLNSATSHTNRYTDDAEGLKRVPQCMAQSRSLAGSPSVIVVTARGFSDNYVTKSNGDTEAGAVVWLQSVIQF